jgi:hypothetical protein
MIPATKSAPETRAVTRNTGQALQSAVEGYLAKRRDVWFMRVNPGTRPLERAGRKWWIRGAPLGTADIVGCLEGGWFFGIELKSGKGKRTLVQKAWAARMEALGAMVCEARSVAEVKAFLDAIAKEN